MLVTIKPTANVAADLIGRTWTVARTGTVQGAPVARLIGTDTYGRDRCFMIKAELLEIVGY